MNESPNGDTPATTSTPEARLADLRAVGGQELVVRVMKRFEAHLIALLLDTRPEEPWSAAVTHQTVGLAGMTGFDRLAETFRRVHDEASPQQLMEARDATADALVWTQRFNTGVDGR